MCRLERPEQIGGILAANATITVSCRQQGFTLIELLVVISIIAILLGILIPSLAASRTSARNIACLSNLNQIGVAIHTYSMEFNDSIPIGPIAPPFLSPTDFYPSTGAPTSLVSLKNGNPVGLGLLLQEYLSREPKSIFCPASDQRIDTDGELAKVGIAQAQCGYYYRHASATRLYDDPSDPVPLRIPLTNLGLNRNGRRIRALVMDTQFLCAPELDGFNVKPRTSHRQKKVNILFSSGDIASRENEEAQFMVDLRDYRDLYYAFSIILGVLEQADEIP
jgi:prepilin-type N-terminal cleavage/methylation domain-containing protein